MHTEQCRHNDFVQPILTEVKREGAAVTVTVTVCTRERQNKRLPTSWAMKPQTHLIDVHSFDGNDGVLELTVVE